MTGRPLHLRPKRVSSRDPPTMATRDSTAPLNGEPSRSKERRRKASPTGLNNDSGSSRSVSSSSETSVTQQPEPEYQEPTKLNGTGEDEMTPNAGRRRNKRSKGGSSNEPDTKDAVEKAGEIVGREKGGSKQNTTNGKNNGHDAGKGPRRGAQGQLITEKVSDSHGDRLTSVKPPPGYEEGSRVDAKAGKNVPSDSPLMVKKRKKQEQTEADHAATELVSGRQAGSGWERSGIRWAPLNVPLKRRLQTLAVLVHGLSIAVLLSIFLFMCAIPIFWPLLFPYTLYILFSSEASSGSLSRRSERLRSSRLWSLFASYFPARLHRSAELEPTRKYVFGYHPHGIISHGAFAAFATEALGFSQLFPGITNTLLTLDSNFRIPFYRDYALAMGLRSVDRHSIENLLTRGGVDEEGMGRAVTIVVGGARESLDAVPGRMRLVLRRRKGFIKLAIRTGADLVPVFGFGENELYQQVDAGKHPWVHRSQLAIKKLAGWTIPLFHARGVFNYDVGFMPYRRPINIVVGKPIPVERMRQPDDEYVNKLHEKYVEELQRLWDEWHSKFASTVKGGLELVE